MLLFVLYMSVYRHLNDKTPVRLLEVVQHCWVEHLNKSSPEKRNGTEKDYLFLDRD